MSPAAIAEASTYPYHNGRCLCRLGTGGRARRRRGCPQAAKALVVLLVLGWVPGVAAADLRVVVNLPAYTLRLLDGDEVVMERPVTIGAPEHPTPVGHWQVDRLIWNPSWTPPPSVAADREEPLPPGPGNPMGAVKLRLTRAIFLHGTERLRQLGQPASHGCIRLANKDARALAEHLQRRLFSEDEHRRLRQRRQARPDEPVAVPLPESVPVRVRYEPLVLDKGGGIIHPDVYGRLDNVRGYLRRALARNMDVPAEGLSLVGGGFLNRLGEERNGPLRFELEIE